MTAETWFRGRLACLLLAAAGAIVGLQLETATAGSLSGWALWALGMGGDEWLRSRRPPEAS